MAVPYPKMPPPQTNRSLRSCGRPTQHVPVMFPRSKTTYWAISCRILSIVLALMFIPMVAKPLGMTDLIIAMLAGISISILWDIFALAHRCLTKRYAPWPLIITFDLIVIPTMLLVFGASAYIDGIAPHFIAPDEHERTIMALVLFVLVSVLHVVSVILDLKLSMSERRPILTSPQRRTSLTKCSKLTARHSLTARRTANSSPDDLEAIMAIERPEDALTKQRADESVRRTSTSSRTEALPLYSAVDPTGAVPAYVATASI